MIRVISLDMDGTLVKSRFVDKVWMEGIPSSTPRRRALTFLPPKST